MANCPECIEKIDDIDSFCPHCGISLSPIIAEEVIDPSFDSTIVITKDELAESNSTPDSAEFTEDSMNEEVVEPNSPELPSPSEPPTDSDSDLPALVDIDPIGEVGPQVSGEVLDEKKTLAPVVESIAEVVVDPVPESEDMSLENDLQASASIDDGEPTSENSFVPIETEDAVDEDELVETTFDEIEAVVESDFGADQDDYFADAESVGAEVTEPEIVFESEFESLESEEPQIVVNDDIEPESIVIEESSDKVETDTEFEPPSSPSILRPEFDLDPEEPIIEKSKYDSVSIMEKKAEPKEEQIVDDEPVTLIGGNLPVSAVDSVPAHVVIAENAENVSHAIDTGEDEAKESRSYTSPNMGGSDTDGKKSKLKPLEEGTVLNDRYEIVRKIGGGGMGAVYLASDKNLGGVLRAVKEMVQSYIEEAQQDKAVNDFRRESMLLTSLEHPAIPTIYDYFFDDKEARFYLVMKYINGGDLSSQLRSAPEGRIDEISVVDWAIQVADVLDYLHRREPPIVYRDLKPSNIMIDGNSGKVMLIDFGIARWINKEEKGVTAVGTMGYAPPELFSGNVEPRSDIYSLGSTMFHLLTGADPQSNPLLIFDFQKNPRPRQINPQLSDQIESILMLAVEYNTDKRFASTAVMRKALEDHLDNLKANRVSFGVKESPKSVTLSDEKVFCGFCGQSIVASDLFCAFCGAKQPIAQQGVHSENYSSVPVTARLTILGTNELQPHAYIIEKNENLVGRRDPMSNIFPEIDLSKFDPQTKISRRHARIWRDGNTFLVEDLGSSNGTILLPIINDPYRLPPNKPQSLTSGDKIKLGDTTLHFVIG